VVDYGFGELVFTQVNVVWRFVIFEINVVGGLKSVDEFTFKE
jgi:hypothetical protein